MGISLNIGSLKGRPLFLYGAGHYGKIATEALFKAQTPPIAIIDRDSLKHGTFINNVPVISLDDFHKKHIKNSLVVVTVYNCVLPLQELNAQGIASVSYAQLALSVGPPLLPYCGVQSPDVIDSNRNSIELAKNLWSDDISRLEFNSQIHWSLDSDPFALPKPRPASETYFDTQIVSFHNHEVFVDCGAFDGDSVAGFILRSPSYKKIIALEPDPENRAKFERRFGGDDALKKKCVSLLPYAVSNKNESVSFQVTGTAGSAINANGFSVQSKRIDDIASHPNPTFIKMDIEGAELNALAGAEKTIRSFKPKLAICLYHDRAHLWEIPLLIKSMRSDYKFYLRRYADECWEIILYAI